MDYWKPFGGTKDIEEVSVAMMDKIIAARVSDVSSGVKDTDSNISVLWDEELAIYKNLQNPHKSRKTRDIGSLIAQGIQSAEDIARFELMASTLSMTLGLDLDRLKAYHINKLEELYLPLSRTSD